MCANVICNQRHLMKAIPHILNNKTDAYGSKFQGTIKLFMPLGKALGVI